MVYVKWAAKAITAVLTVILAGIVAGEINADPIFVYAIQATLAGIAVFLVPNGPFPTE